ncbi:hypothetical protein ACE103_09090 [Bradyrhizobium sp. ma5]|uniref:hypothetical protein n=1 Tax=Bradyrhizobium sp. ma5 TaxID=3344828 RepID=UPI0035D4E747
MCVTTTKPPSCNLKPRTVFVGKDRYGNWIARERSGMFGGLFVSRAQALKYAQFKNGPHPETIIEVSCEAELNIPGLDIPTAHRPDKQT